MHVTQNHFWTDVRIFTLSMGVLCCVATALYLWVHPCSARTMVELEAALHTAELQRDMAWAVEDYLRQELTQSRNLCKGQYAWQAAQHIPDIDPGGERGDTGR